MGGVTGTGTGTVTERAGHSRRNRTIDGERKGPERAVQATGRGGRKSYAGSGRAGVLRVI